MSNLLFLAGVTGLALSLAAASPPPPPTPTEAAQIKQNIGGVKNSPTQSATAIPQIPATVINQPSAAPTKTDTTKEGDTKSNNAPFNWSNLLTVVFTGVLTWVGIMQWLSMRKQSSYMRRQADYMRRELPVSINAAKSARFNAIAAQDAVKLAERNAAITGRAVVLVESVTVANRSSEVSQLESHNLIIFTLKNFGQTIASSVEFSGKMCGICQWPFPDVPTFNIAPQGTFSWATPKSIGAWIGDETNISAVNGRRAWLEYSIIVTYIDAFKNKHTYHCEGRYEPALTQFLITSSTSD